jgi:hypothetical protein
MLVEGADVQAGYAAAAATLRSAKAPPLVSAAIVSGLGGWVGEMTRSERAPRSSERYRHGSGSSASTSAERLPRHHGRLVRQPHGR